MEPKAWILSSTTYGTVDYCTRLQRHGQLQSGLEWTAVDRFIMYSEYVDRNDVPTYVRTYSQCSQIHESRMIVVQDSTW
jgi:hypothetical protein